MYISKEASTKKLCHAQRILAVKGVGVLGESVKEEKIKRKVKKVDNLESSSEELYKEAKELVAMSCNFTFKP